jgi:anti-sigma factor RsiW
MMDCAHVEELLSRERAGRTEGAGDGAVAGPGAGWSEVDAHLAGCASCRHVAEVIRTFSEALDRKLPRYAAPAELRRRVEQRLGLAGAGPVAGAGSGVPAAAEARAEAPRADGVTVPDLVADRSVGARPGRPRTGLLGRGPAARAAVVATAWGVGAAALVLVVAWAGTRMRGHDFGSADVITEAVNDHLRIVSSTHPVEIEGGGIHQVRPWFTGRLEFAPPVSFSGDADFPLLGGSVGYFHDRKAAVFSFRRRLHTITLLVLPTEGLEWPDGRSTSVGRLSVVARTSRGFSLLFWKDRGFGYVLVSDVSGAELERLAPRLVEGD